MRFGGWKNERWVSIWSFPSDMSIADCIKLAKTAGFDGIELALNETGPMGLESKEDEIAGYKALAESTGISISSVATGLYWAYSFTSASDEAVRKAAIITKKQIDAPSSFMPALPGKLLFIKELAGPLEAECN